MREHVFLQRVLAGTKCLMRSRSTEADTSLTVGTGLGNSRGPHLCQLTWKMSKPGRASNNKNAKQRVRDLIEFYCIFFPLKITCGHRLDPESSRAKNHVFK